MMLFKECLKPKLMSNILRFPESVPKEKIASASVCKSLKLMLNQGFIKPVSPGVFNLMPLTVRSVEKLCNLVDAVMLKISAQKVLFPTLIQDSLMKTSGRWDNNDNLFKLKDRNSCAYCLGPTHEEVATSLLSKLRLSYKFLPVRLYQISTKFRDEMNPKLGLLRGREFIMKDMYTFDCSEEEAEKTYHAVCNIYHQFFQLLDVEHIKVKASSGDIGGKSSHEFHIISDVGEDRILFCPKCRKGINAELGIGNEANCTSCNLPFIKHNAIEVGHAFLLGTTYSEPFQAEYDTTNHTFRKLQMGCYGLGITRILAACVEHLSSTSNIRWPLHIAPFLLSVVIPKKGSKEETVCKFAEDLCQSLSNIQWLKSNIVIDDRTNFTIGRRVQDAYAIGIPYIVVVSKSALEELPKIEVIDSYKDQTLFLTHREVMDFFRSKSFQSVSS